MAAQDWEERRVCYSWCESKHFDLQGSYRWMSRAMDNSHAPRMPHNVVPLQEGSVSLQSYRVVRVQRQARVKGDGKTCMQERFHV